MEPKHFAYIHKVFDRRNDNLSDDPSWVRQYLSVSQRLRGPQDTYVGTLTRMLRDRPEAFSSQIFGEALAQLVNFASALQLAEEQQSFGLAMIAALMVENGISFPDIGEKLSADLHSYKRLKAQSEGLTDNVMVAEAVMRAEAAASRAFESATQIAKSQAGANETFSDLLKLAENARSEMNTAIEHAAQTLNMLEARGETAETRINELMPHVDRLNSTVDATSSGVESFTEAVRESLGQTKTRDLWKRRAFAHRISFGISLSLMLFLIAVLPFVAFLYHEAVIGFLVETNNALSPPPSLPVSDPTTQSDAAFHATVAILNRILVLGLPIALYIWLIKIVIRFNQHNLLLAEDAAQRSTMIDTYVNLIASNAAPADRQIIFTALFRPGIAQATDNVDLPIIEAIKAMRG